MKQTMPSRKELLVILWGMYSKQKQWAADAGCDVFEDIDRMRGWFRKALEGTASTEDRVELFGADPPSEKKYQCAKCGDNGWYYSERTSFERAGPGGARAVLQVPGMRVCICVNGEKKNLAISEHAKPEEKGKRGRL